MKAMGSVRIEGDPNDPDVREIAKRMTLRLRDMGSACYLLGGDDGRTPVLCDNILDWQNWIPTSGDQRQVAFDKLADCSVSTCFIGHQLGDIGTVPPLLFESLVWLNEPSNVPPAQKVMTVVAHYATWREAEIGHGAILKSQTERIRVERLWGNQ